MAAVVTGAIAAVSGFGIGSILTPVLMLSMPTAEAVAVLAIPHAWATAIRFSRLRSAVDLPTLKEFRKKESIRPELLSDFKREVSRTYGTLIEERFFSGRAYFLIDREGVVRWAYMETTPSTRRDNAELLGELAKLA